VTDDEIAENIASIAVFIPEMLALVRRLSPFFGDHKIGCHCLGCDAGVLLARIDERLNERRPPPPETLIR